MTMKEIAKKIIASINPGNADISGIGDGTIKGALVELNSKSINLTQTTLENVPITTSVSSGYMYARSAFSKIVSENANVLMVAPADWAGGTDIFSVMYDPVDDKLYIVSHTSQTVTSIRLNILYTET